MSQPHRYDSMTRRAFVRGAAAAIAGAALAESLQAQQAGRMPNVVLILADDLGYGDLGCYGQEKVKTPHLDALAAQGTRFVQCYAGASLGAASRCSLMTGYHTGHATIRGNALVPLRRDDVTVAEVLRQAGYKTGLIGKWALGESDTEGVPNKQGFDEFYGFLNLVHAQNHFPPFLWRNEQKEPIAQNANNQKRVYADDLFILEAAEFIRRHKAEPFFLLLAPTLPHAKLEVPEPGPYAATNWPEPEKIRAAMVTRLDTGVGTVLSVLKELGIEKETMVLFSSCNGPASEGGAKVSFFSSSGPLRGMKRDLYEGGIRVPMIVRWPGVAKAGGTSEFPWAFWDVLPTAAAIAGVAAPANIDGTSILPTLKGQAQTPHEFLYWECHEPAFTQAVRMGQWKAVRAGLNGPLELYHLDKDPRETTNVAAQHPEIVKKIDEYLKSARTESKEFPVREAGGNAQP